MSEISTDAVDLLVTLRRIKKIRTMGGEFIDKRSVLIEYGYKQNGKQLDSLFNELSDSGYIKYQSGAYLLLAKALNLSPSANSSAQNVTIYSDIQNSNIAHMSTNAAQALKLESLDEEVKTQLNLLINALEKKDNARIKNIFDGMIVSAPALVLQILQIGLGIKG